MRFGLMDAAFPNIYVNKDLSKEEREYLEAQTEGGTTKEGE